MLSYIFELLLSVLDKYMSSVLFQHFGSIARFIIKDYIHKRSSVIQILVHEHTYETLGRHWRHVYI